MAAGTGLADQGPLGLECVGISDSGDFGQARCPFSVEPGNLFEFVVGRIIRAVADGVVLYAGAGSGFWLKLRFSDE